jgi:hypothetical protein
MPSYFEAHRATLENAQRAFARGRVGAVEKQIDNPEAVQVARPNGVIAASKWSTHPVVLDEAADELAAADVNVPRHLTGHLFNDQSASFTDNHVSGANRGGSAGLAGAAFGANRSRGVGIRRPAAA